jgi:flavodoxin
MKVLTAYYSRTGNNEKLVNELQAKLGCDVEKIIDTVNRKGAWGFLKSGYQAYRKKTSRIEPIKKDPSSYDLVIVACPLWASLMPPPIRTYIFENKNKFNKVALMSVSGGGKGNDKTIPDFETALGKKTSAILLLAQAELKKGNYEEKLQEFSESILKLES